MDMLTIRDDDEAADCLICGGPIVRPFPCQHGCGEWRNPIIDELLSQTSPALTEEVITRMRTTLPLVHWRQLGPG